MRRGDTPAGAQCAGCAGVAPGFARAVTAARHQLRGQFGVMLGLSLALLIPVTAAAQPLDVEMADGRLSVSAEDASVRSLIEAVAVEAGLTLEDAELLEGQVTVQFRGLVISDGLARILGERSYMLVYSVSGHEGGRPVPVRLRLFGTSTVPVSARPVEGSALLGGEHGALFEMLESHSDPWDKQDAMEALALAGDTAAARRLGGAALADPDVDVRSVAVDALANLGGSGAVEMLQIALRDTERAIRQQAVRALEEIGGDAAVQALKVALGDADADLRLEAVDAIGGLGGPGAFQALEHAATDPDSVVRGGAEDWLTELKGGGW